MMQHRTDSADVRVEKPEMECTEKLPVKLKIIGSMNHGGYTEQVFLNGVEQETPLPSGHPAKRFWDAFHPESLTREMAGHCREEGFVLVFRTEEAALEPFMRFLQEHGG